MNGSCHLWYHIGCEKRTHDALRFRPRIYPGAICMRRERRAEMIKVAEDA